MRSGTEPGNHKRKNHGRSKGAVAGGRKHVAIERRATKLRRLMKAMKKSKAQNAADSTGNDKAIVPVGARTGSEDEDHEGSEEKESEAESVMDSEAPGRDQYYVWDKFYGKIDSLIYCT